jgi:hypothetical protein
MIRHLCIQSDTIFFFFEDRCSSIAIEDASESGDAYNAWSRNERLRGEGGAGGRAFGARGDHAAGPLRSNSCFSGFEVSRA